MRLLRLLISIGYAFIPCQAVDVVISLHERLPTFEGRMRYWDYSQIIFLSESLAVVASNHKGPAVGSMSPVLLIDVKKGAVQARSEFALPNHSDLMGRLTDRTFVLATTDGLLECTAELRCVQVSKLTGPVVVSPDGKRVMLDDLNIGQILFSAATWKPLAAFPIQRPGSGIARVLPGNGEIAIQKAGSVAILRADAKSYDLKSVTVNLVQRCCWFVGSKYIAVQDTRSSQLVVFGLDGSERYRIAIDDPFHTVVIPACCGGPRFAIAEVGYTAWNSLTNFWDIDKSRPQDEFRARIFDADSRLEIAKISNDPRPGTFHLGISREGDVVGTIWQNQIRFRSIP